MRYCVYGLGAVGGQIAAQLTHAGLDTVGVARQHTCDVIREKGLLLEQADGSSSTAQIEVGTQASNFDDIDVIILAVKATTLSTIARDVEQAVRPTTTVMTAMNGLPWWFTDGLTLGAAIEDNSTNSRLRQVLPAHHVIGCAVHLSARTAAPGHVVRTSGNGLVLGPAADGGAAVVNSPRVATDLRRAGFDVDETEDVRQAVWYKLWGNLTLNPVSMLTRSTVDHIVNDPQAVGFVEACMREAQAIGDEVGLTIPSAPSARIELTRRYGRFSTSMHQDAEAGRPVELDALVGSVHRLGRATGVPTPNLNALLGLSRLHAAAHELLPEA